MDPTVLCGRGAALDCQSLPCCDGKDFHRDGPARTHAMNAWRQKRADRLMREGDLLSSGRGRSKQAPPPPQPALESKSTQSRLKPLPQYQPRSVSLDPFSQHAVLTEASISNSVASIGAGRDGEPSFWAPVRHHRAEQRTHERAVVSGPGISNSVASIGAAGDGEPSFSAPSRPPRSHAVFHVPAPRVNAGGDQSVPHSGVTPKGSANSWQHLGGDATAENQLLSQNGNVQQPSVQALDAKTRVMSNSLQYEQQQGPSFATAEPVRNVVATSQHNRLDSQRRQKEAEAMTSSVAPEAADGIAEEDRHEVTRKWQETESTEQEMGQSRARELTDAHRATDLSPDTDTNRMRLEMAATMMAQQEELARALEGSGPETSGNGAPALGARAHSGGALIDSGQEGQDKNEERGAELPLDLEGARLRMKELHARMAGKIELPQIPERKDSRSKSLAATSPAPASPANTAGNPASNVASPPEAQSTPTAPRSADLDAASAKESVILKRLADAVGESNSLRYQVDTLKAQLSLLPTHSPGGRPVGDADEAIQLQQDMEAAKNQLASALARNAALGLELQKARDQIRCMSGLADTVAAADAGGDGNGKHQDPLAFGSTVQPTPQGSRAAKRGTAQGALKRLTRALSRSNSSKKTA